MISSLRDDRFERLPKWAQQEITRLKRDLNYAKERLAGGDDESRVFADPYADPPRPLGYDTAIEFRFGDRWSDKINVRIDGDGIKVMGGSRLSITPEAANVVRIGTREL